MSALRPTLIIVSAVIFAGFMASSLANGAEINIEAFQVPPGFRPHDVAPAIDGRVWYTGQNKGVMGLMDSKTGDVVVNTAWPRLPPPRGHCRCSGRRLDHRRRPKRHRQSRWRDNGGGRLSTARRHRLRQLEHSGFRWQRRFVVHRAIGHLWPLRPGNRGHGGVFRAPGPGTVRHHRHAGRRIYFASLAGSYVGKVDITTGAVTVLQPPTRNQGARRVWSDSHGNIWVAEWNAGQVAKYDPVADTWAEWKLPGSRPQAYAIYVDDQDIVWLTDFGANAIVRFDPATEEFQSFPSPRNRAQVRQLLGRQGEVWAPESGRSCAPGIEAR